MQGGIDGIFQAMLDPSLLEPEKQRPLKRSEYWTLVERGVFEDERVELLNGIIVQMSPQDPEHASPVQQLTLVLVPQLVGRAIVRIQSSFYAAGESVPEPDVAIVPLGSYAHAHPERAHCIIEVAYSSLRKDRLVKAPIYAASNVSEYWVVDSGAKRVLVYRDSNGEAYRRMTEHDSSEVLVLEAFPDVRVSISDLFA